MGTVPGDEFTANAILKKKIKQKFLGIRWRFCRERRSVRVLVYGDRINAIRVEARHIESRPSRVACPCHTLGSSLGQAFTVPSSYLRPLKMESGEQSVVLPPSTLSSLSLSLWVELDRIF